MFENQHNIVKSFFVHFFPPSQHGDHLQMPDSQSVSLSWSGAAGHKHTSTDKWELLTCAMVWDPRERLWRESRGLFVIEWRLGRSILKVTWIGDRFLSGQDQRWLNGVLLGADATVHRGAELNSRYIKAREERKTKNSSLGRQWISEADYFKTNFKS